MELNEVEHLLSTFEFDITIGNHKKLRINSKQNFDGLFLKINELTNVTYLELSLHKYFNYTKARVLNNSTQYSYSNTLETVKMLETKLGKSISDANVTYYEIGLNLLVSQPPKQYIDDMKTILTGDSIKKLYINPIVRNEHEKITEFDKNKTKVYKVYDKIQEMTCKRRKDIPPNVNILRIESKYKYVRGLKLGDLLHPTQFYSIVNKFFLDWDSVEFNRYLSCPKGTNGNQIALIHEILESGNTQEIIKKYRDKLSDGLISAQNFRTIREFCSNKWDVLKPQVSFKPLQTEIEFRKLLKQGITKMSK